MKSSCLMEKLMNLAPVINILILAILLSLGYKLYLDTKLSNDKREGDLLFLFTGIFSIWHFWPISKNKYGKKNEKIVKNANITLYIFYICFILVILLGFMDSLFHSGLSF